MIESSAPKLLKILQCLRDVHPEFPLTYAVLLTEVALEPGSSQTALAIKVQCAPPTLSRIISVLSNPDGPYKLLRITPHETSRRQHCVHLTPAGQRLIEKLQARLTKPN